MNLIKLPIKDGNVLLSVNDIETLHDLPPSSKKPQTQLTLRSQRAYVILLPLEQVVQKILEQSKP